MIFEKPTYFTSNDLKLLSSETNSGKLWDAAKIRSSSFSAGKTEAKKMGILIG